MEKGKITKKVVFCKECPLFKTKCKKDKCVFYSEDRWLDNRKYIGKKMIGETTRRNRIETEFSVDGVRGVIRGYCSFPKSSCEAVRIHYTHIYKEKEKIEEIKHIDKKSKAWWEFWK